MSPGVTVRRVTTEIMFTKSSQGVVCCIKNLTWIISFNFCSEAINWEMLASSFYGCRPWRLRAELAPPGLCSLGSGTDLNPFSGSLSPTPSCLSVKMYYCDNQERRILIFFKRSTMCPPIWFLSLSIFVEKQNWDFSLKMESRISGLCARRAIHIVSLIFATTSEGRDYDSYPDLRRDKTDLWQSDLVVVT